MAFLGSIGKFLGGAVKSVAPIIAPIASFGTDLLLKKVTGGTGLTALGGFLPGAGGPPAISPGAGIFSGFQTSFGGPVARPPATFPMQQPPPVVMTGGAVALTKPVFDIIVKLAARLGIAIRTPAAVTRIGRSIIAKLLRFARANPGLTIINLLTNLGLTLFEANEIITWWTTHGKRRRRIKVTNVKALNRSVRRLEGFRRLSQRVEMALSRRGGVRSSSRTRRCPKCRRSPCCC